MITTVPEFVVKCGGRTPTAKEFGVVDHAVSNWQKRGHFPGWAVPRVMQIAQTNNWAIAPELLTASKPARRRPESNKAAQKVKSRGRRRKISLSAAE